MDNFQSVKSICNLLDTYVAKFPTEKTPIPEARDYIILQQSVIDSLKSVNAEQTMLLKTANTEIAELKDKLHRRNMLANNRRDRIRELVKQIKRHRQELNKTYPYLCTLVCMDRKSVL